MFHCGRITYVGFLLEEWKRKKKKSYKVKFMNHEYKVIVFLSKLINYFTKFKFGQYFLFFFKRLLVRVLNSRPMSLKSFISACTVAN